LLWRRFEIDKLDTLTQERYEKLPACRQAKRAQAGGLRYY